MPSPRHTSKLEQTCQRDAFGSCSRAASGREPRRAPAALRRRGAGGARTRGSRKSSRRALAPGKRRRLVGEQAEPSSASARCTTPAGDRPPRDTSRRAWRARRPARADVQGSSIRAQILTAARILLRSARRARDSNARPYSPSGSAVRRNILVGSCCKRGLPVTRHGLALARAEPSSLLDLGGSSRLRWRRSDRGESSKSPRMHINQRLGNRPAQAGSVYEGGLLQAAKPASESGTAAAVSSRLPACAPRVSTSSEVEEIWQLAR